ncbi:MAG: phosphoglycerate dehydrogenase [Gammaproteobacteria bacterium]|jgi:D-3-phosphoglycerate dehydrogenase|nr:phosphoglycerate dehydrogenase [Gammaproteobacteria bacterium]MDP6616067.1 phosphoglycerate dehydrogenase [Gammaproteobacteria bacterium]MDP6695330.1 phosphoglycerate dehydrogenase [Gammaproteobacteria bacterium]MDP7041934.1 phosphoglycerate dehydrogenase [Gammaproteobacteria bacterium]
MYNILTLNNISEEGLKRLPSDKYSVADDAGDPAGILVRSYKMHDMELGASLEAVARAGAGVNNIPIDKLSARGVPVFNAPGANANAVKELVIGGMLLAARNLAHAWDYTQHLEGEGDELARAVEAGKKKFVGYELPGRTLGVVGLGAIGVRVANAALDLGMNVIGFDAMISVERAWELHSGVQQARSLDDLLSRSDMVTLHVPLLDATRDMISKEGIGRMPAGAVILNFARDPIVDEEAVLASLEAGHLGCYVTDFPTRPMIGNDKIITLPHLGASTAEAEVNCAIMVADNMRNYLENGNIRYSVNFPEADMPRTNAYRLTVANENVPNMVGQVSTFLADAGLNIEDLLNKSRGELAYTIVDLDGPVPDDVIGKIAGIDGVLKVRNLGQPV